MEPERAQDKKIEMIKGGAVIVKEKNDIVSILRS